VVVNWRRGLLRLGIVAAVFVALPFAVLVYVDWHEHRDFETQRLQTAGERATSPKALYREFLEARGTALAVPDARIISRASIPTTATIRWRIVTIRSILAVLVIGAAFSWAALGFRRN
jgi:hypothetical protein